MYFLQPLVPLSSARDSQRLEEILEYLRNEVKTRRILLHPYFRDFDKVVGSGVGGLLESCNGGFKEVN